MDPAGRQLTGRALDRRVALAMVKRRAAAAGLPSSTCCHTFRATGITAYAVPQGRGVAARADRPIRCLRRAIGVARHKARTLLTQRMAERLSAPMREGLDALVAVDDDQPHSPLNRIKASSSNPSVGGMKRLLARLELIEATGVLGVNVDWGQRQLPADPVPQRGNRVSRPGCAGWRPHAVTSRWCASCTRRGATRSTKPSTCTASSSTSTTCSRRNARPSTGSFTATASSARCCSIPTSATTS